MKFEKWQEVRAEVFARDIWSCQYPGCGVVGGLGIQIAHRIADTESNRKECRALFGLKRKAEEDAIINHPMNLVTSCAKHNSRFNVGNVKAKRLELFRAIYEKLFGGEDGQRVVEKTPEVGGG
ncbi:HNH endonuclease [Candidatus Magnetobacterium casense]|uniref:HNH endonuclease n=1 Tax=Candidatus Magnetobacterium casense TaxID=1455061 RepID=A0ABS6S0T1_9BACT|nr:hypothetical protein [Candidatus Magnetobacterium casensis]MBV6342416.1 hypothetical protein [Candidatus Magnetobacterium casensis]